MPNGSTSSIAKTVIICLVIVAGALLFSMVFMHNLDVTQYEAAKDAIEVDNKALKSATEKFQHTRKELEQTVSDFSAYRNKAEGEIAQLKTDLTTTRTTLATTEKALAETAGKLKTVQSEKDELTATLDRLQRQITDYNAQIDNLKKKLQVEAKDKEGLLAAIKDLEAKRDELQRKWNDLTELRKQVRTLVTAEHIRQREQLSEKRGYFGVYQNSGLRNFKTYDEVKQEKVSGATVIEVHRDGVNPPPKTPAPTVAPAPAPVPAPAPAPGPQPKVLAPGQQPQPPK